MANAILADDGALQKIKDLLSNSNKKHASDSNCQGEERILKRPRIREMPAQQWSAPLNATPQQSTNSVSNSGKRAATSRARQSLEAEKKKDAKKLSEKKSLVPLADKLSSLLSSEALSTVRAASDAAMNGDISVLLKSYREKVNALCRLDEALALNSLVFKVLGAKVDVSSKTSWDNNPNSNVLPLYAERIEAVTAARAILNQMKNDLSILRAQISKHNLSRQALKHMLSRT